MEMGEVTYYFASNENEEELNKIIIDPLFNKIVAYLSNRNGQEVILRQIKAAIPTDSNLELYLDKLIKHKLLKRENRRYTLIFPIYTNENLLKLPDSIEKSFRKIMEEQTMANDYFLFGEWLWSLFFEKEQGTYFFGVSNSIENLSFFLKKEAGNDSLRFVSIYPDNLIPLDLANYFNLLSRGQELPPKFDSLQNLIGDVDIHYFISQIQKVMRSVKRNNYRERRQTIFQEALLVTGDLKKNEENQLYLATPTIAGNDYSDEIQNRLDELKKDLISLWETIENENQRMFYKQQLYSFLFQNYLPNKYHSISYFKLL
ncbi:DUF1803 domain-containing protein [Enterococcus sp. AZ126]|uniref:DUF1803 domain-containing protein n=1 Tax=Enterococcus sp. AZ126 TaxID=2774635 RepID=UPI003F293383